LITLLKRTDVWTWNNIAEKLPLIVVFYHPVCPVYSQMFHAQ